MSTKRVRKFNTHMAEATDSDNPDLLAFAYFPMTQRRPRGDASAQQWRDGREVLLLMAHM
jgi:hypothetical protein